MAKFTYILDKKTIRRIFRQEVFERDGYKCRLCGKAGYDHNDGTQRIVRDRVALDAHHISDRHNMPAGGYVKENGISVCEECHLKVEHPAENDIEHQPKNLYDLIGSSLEIATKASLALEVAIAKQKR